MPKNGRKSRIIRGTRRVGSRVGRSLGKTPKKSTSAFLGRGFRNYAVGSVALAGINTLPVTRSLGAYKQGVDMAIVGTVLKSQKDLQTAGVKSVLAVVMQKKLLPSLLSASAGFNLAGILGVGNGNGNGNGNGLGSVSSVVNEEALSP